MVKLISNTALLGSPDVNALLCEWLLWIATNLGPHLRDTDDGIYIGIWNSIENDFVLSAACLPSVPPFFRACKLFAKTHIMSFSRRTHSTSLSSLKSSDRPGRRDESLAIELTRNDELPGMWNSKIGHQYSGSE